MIVTKCLHFEVDAVVPKYHCFGSFKEYPASMSKNSTDPAKLSHINENETSSSKLM